MAYIPTNERVRSAAQEGIDLRDEYGRGGTEVGRRTAGRIVRNEVDLELAVKMRAYFARHAVDRDAPGFDRSDEQWPSNGFIAWQLWGGDPGRAWAERVVAESEKSGTPSTMTQHKTYSAAIEVKAASDEAPHGEFTALVSVFGNVDLVGDRVVKGAFADSLAEYAASGKSIPVVWSHDWNTPESYIGKALSAEETDDGLLVRAAFFDTDRAQTVRNLLTERVVSEFSFAYDVVDEQKADDGANELTSLRLLEVGPTLKGANPETVLVAAKAAEVEAKAGRVLSTKNEAAIREAKQLLDGVLSSLSEAGKSAPVDEDVEVVATVDVDEPVEEVVVAPTESGLDPAVALALLDLEDV